MKQKTLLEVDAHTAKKPRETFFKDVGPEATLAENLAQDLDNTFSSYTASTEQLWRLHRKCCDLERRQMSKNSQEFDFDTDPNIMLSSDKSADEYGTKFVEIFCSLLHRKSGCAPRRSQVELMKIVANNLIHKSDLVSVQAAEALSLQVAAFPPASVCHGDGGGLSLMARSGTWEMRDLESVESWRDGALDGCVRADASSSVKLDYWDIFVGFAERARAALASGSFGRESGASLLMFTQVVNLLVVDFRGRMEVFTQRAESLPKPKRPTSLLKMSLLACLLENGEAIYRTSNVGSLVDSLVFMAAAGRAQGEAQPSAAGCKRATPMGLVDAATVLLNMILEYYGILEDHGCFLRALNSAFRHNLRVGLDRQMYTSYKDSLEDTCERRLFLSALAPRDRIRFLGSVFALFRAKRAKDEQRFPGLTSLQNIYESQEQDVHDFVDGDSCEILSYVAYDTNYAKSIKGIDSWDGMAMVVSQVMHAAAELVPCSDNPEAMQEALLSSAAETVACLRKQPLSEEAALELSIALLAAQQARA
eukprot:CAMPEP_0177584864 /NCGR_PEP_ID=MMETSP0419_2-20121207/4153_1 /TAXON_ID=582737 /ORGANISM="Tetraselmis sp., Strain GSL018" /LENGTH=534 /DNA_ID=CAMNT_0019074491 /DNA_START=80 /DNA_END=1681 /DNA_ORIENTATION=+